MSAVRKLEEDTSGIYTDSLGEGEPEPAGNESEETAPIFGRDPIDSEPEEARETKPTQHVGPREPLTELVTLAWGGIGTVLVQSQADPPVGRVLQFQAPMAGKKIDALIAGSWLDSLLQPLAKRGNDLQDVAALVLLPLLVGAWERQPELMQPMEPVMRQLVRASLVEMVPMLKKQRAEEARATKAMADLSDVIDFEPGQDPLDAILGSFFRDVAPATEPETGTDG